MTIEKLPEFAKNGDKHTRGLDVDSGFPRANKPERQWFNELFNQLTKGFNTVADATNQSLLDLNDAKLEVEKVKKDTGVTVTAKFSSAVERPQSDKNKDAIDVRDFGVIADKETDWTDRIAEILSEIGSDKVLYIPPGVKWNYHSAYSSMQDFQTIIDASGCDFARNVWQTSVKHWHKTNSNTKMTSGNTQSIAGDWHPALFIDTWSEDHEGKRASVVFSIRDNGRWQIGLDETDDFENHFHIAQYGTTVYGAKNLSIGHQSGSRGGCFGFNSNLYSSSSDSYVFGKPMSVPADQAVVSRITRPSTDTGDFIDIVSYGNIAKYRRYIKKDGKIELYTASGGKITTTPDGAVYGQLRQISDATRIISKELSCGGFITNYNATTGIEMFLPEGVKGYAFEFSVDVEQFMIIKTRSTDKFIGMELGAGLKSNVIGSKLRVICIAANIWTLEKVGTWEAA